MMPDEELTALLDRIRATTTQEERERWAASQPPMILALDPRDAEDSDGPCFESFGE